MPHSNERRVSIAGFAAGLLLGAWIGLIALRAIGIISTPYIVLLSPLLLSVALVVCGLLAIVALAVVLSALAEIMDREPAGGADYFDQ